MDIVEIVAVDHLGDRLQLEPDVEYRITELVSVTVHSDGVSPATQTLKVRAVRG